MEAGAVVTRQREVDLPPPDCQPRRGSDTPRTPLRALPVTSVWRTGLAPMTT